MTQRRPLDDVRIVAVEQFGAGPFGSMHLADLGADVIKIEDPRNGGDVGRYVPPHQTGEDSLFFEAFNRNKRSLSLDLLTAAGQSVLHDLVRCSDAVYSNLRGDIPQRLKLRYEDLSSVNPRIVCCSLSGFGMTGPRRAEPASNYILQGMAGWMSLTGEPDGPPQKSGLSLVDYSGRIRRCVGSDERHSRRPARRRRQGLIGDTSLCSTSRWACSPTSSAWNLTGGYIPEADGAFVAPIDRAVRCVSNGRWLDRPRLREGQLFVRLCNAMGLNGLGVDERFSNAAARYRNRTALLPILRASTEREVVGGVARGSRPSGRAVWPGKFGRRGVSRPASRCPWIDREHRTIRASVKCAASVAQCESARRHRRAGVLRNATNTRRKFCATSYTTKRRRSTNFNEPGRLAEERSAPAFRRRAPARFPSGRPRVRPQSRPACSKNCHVTS